MSSINHIANQVIRALGIQACNSRNIELNVDGVDQDVIDDESLVQEAFRLSQLYGQTEVDNRFRWLNDRGIELSLVDMEDRMDEILDELVNITYHIIKTPMSWFEQRELKSEMWCLNKEYERLDESSLMFTKDVVDVEYDCPTLKDAVYQYIIDNVKMSCDECITMLTYLDDFDMNLKNKVECEVALLHRLALNTDEKAGWWAACQSKIKGFNKIRSNNFFKVEIEEASVYNMDLDSIVDFRNYCRKLAGPRATNEDVMIVMEQLLDNSFVA